MSELKRSAQIALQVEGEADAQAVAVDALRDLELAELDLRSAATMARQIAGRLARMGSDLEGF